MTAQQMMALSTETLLTHARRFGSDGVIDTAVAAGYGVDQLATLIEGLDSIEAKRDAERRFSQWKKPRRTPEQRARKLLGLEDEEG